MCVRPDDRIAAIPIAVDCPMRAPSTGTPLIRQRAPARHNPHEPSLWMRAGMMPTLALPGEITPRTVRPTNLDFDPLHNLPHLHHVQRRNALR